MEDGARGGREMSVRREVSVVGEEKMFFGRSWVY